MFAVKQFRHYVLGSNFLIQTDHRALNGLLTSTDLSGRLQRWLTTLQEYLPFEITYRKGKVNANADCLSRLPLPTTDAVVRAVVDESGDVKLAEIGLKQRDDPAWRDIWRYKIHGEIPLGLSNKEIFAFERECEQYVISDGVLQRVYHINGIDRLDNTVLQLCVTAAMVPSILKEIHDDTGGHLSAGKTYGKLQQRYYWKNMHKDTIDYCRSCEVCARRKVPHRQPGIPVLSPQVDHLSNYGPMQCIAIDCIGGGNQQALTMTDIYTKYGAVIPIRRQTTANIALSLMDKWFNVHGMPKLVICDNGSGFKSKTMKDVMELLGIKIHYVSPYHPESNGACERLNGTIVNMLASYTADGNQARWTHFIQGVVFAYNTSIHNATGYTPYFLVHGREALIGSDAALSLNTDVRSYPEYVRHMQHDLAFAHQHISDRVKQAAEDREKLNDELKSLAVFQPGDQVYVYAPPKSGDGLSAKLMSPYHGPYTVLRATSRVTYLLQNNATRKKTAAHVTLLKKAVPRPDHLVLHDVAASAASLAAAAEPEASNSDAEGVAAQTRAQRAVRHRQRAEPRSAAASAVPFAAAHPPFRSVPFGLSESPARWMTRHGIAHSPPLSLPAVDEEEKYDDVPELVDIDRTPAATTATHANRADSSGDDEDESSDDDLSTPDEELEEGEVPEAELRAHGLLPPRM